MPKKITFILIRFFDIQFSLLALFFFMPLLILISLILLLTGENEVFYLQKRVGKKGKNFKLIKFCTMLKNSADFGSKELTLPDDKRVLPVGKFLRMTKLNELPQLINVLKGDISLIGPRPQTPYFLSFFNEEDIKIITDIKPGLSGLGSIVFRNEEAIFKNVKDPKFWDEKILMPYKGKLERWYAENISLDKYFLLIVLTILVVISPHKVKIFNTLKQIPQPPEILKEKLEII